MCSRSGGQWCRETHHVNTWTANECIDFLDRRDPTCPFFLWMSFSRPHSQYDPPAPYDAWYELGDVPRADSDAGCWISAAVNSRNAG